MYRVDCDGSVRVISFWDGDDRLSDMNEFVVAESELSAVAARFGVVGDFEFDEMVRRLDEALISYWRQLLSESPGDGLLVSYGLDDDAFERLSLMVMSNGRDQ